MKIKKQTITLSVVLLASLGLLSSCTSNSKYTAKGKIKNVIVMIGDGMGPQQIGLLDSYIRYANHPQVTNSAFSRIAKEGVVGISRTESHDTLVADSAASATQFASGQLAGAEMIGTDYNGDATTTMLEIAKQQGRGVGLVSDTRMTHATPAGFAAHQKHRSYENEIAEDILANEVDILLSGGIRHWVPQSVNDKGEVYDEITKLTGGNVQIKSKRKDDKNLLAEAAAKGYELSFDKNSLMASKADKILGLYSYSAMLDGIEYHKTKNSPERTEPSLVEMTEKALSVLEKDDSGFFLMVEGGLIDWAAHDNDAGTMLHEMVKFSEAINYVMDWMQGRDDTILIVSADHETGGFGFAYSRNDLPEGKPLQGNVFNGDLFQPQWNFGDLNTLDKLYAQKIAYNTLFAEFDGLPKNQQNASNLMKLVNRNTEFPITLDEAKRVLEVEQNNYYVKGHDYLDAKKFPRITEREEFFVYGSEMRKNLLAIVTAKYSNIVWATDNHTSTPVYVFAYGPEKLTNQFGEIQHSTEWAQKLINMM